MIVLAAALGASGLLLAGPSASATRGSAKPRGPLHATTGQPRATGTLDGDKAASSRLARTPASLRNLVSAKRVPVMIKYDYDALASYGGAIAGFAATSPSVTGRELHRAPTTSQARYLAYLSDRERTITARVRAAAPGTAVSRGFRIVYGGVAAQVPGNRIRALLRVPGVVAVQRDPLYQPLTDSSAQFINATAAYQSLHTTRNAGHGILFGDFDTGLWPEHPSFRDQGNLPAYTGTPLPCDFGDNPLTHRVDVFRCNNKLVGGKAFLATYSALNPPEQYGTTARDSDGHGSHTSSTAAGNVVRHVQTVGPRIARINGMAPGAQVMEYKVCGMSGCYGSDTTAATEQAITDGVKVINYSISGGADPTTSPTELAFLDAYAAGVFVAASAGNEGPAAGTANHASPWVVSVGASTQRREFVSTVSLHASNGATFTATGASLTHGVTSPHPVVAAASAPYSDKFCSTAAPAGRFTGKIVVCERGGPVGLGRVQKGFNVKQGGAAGMILYNPTLADIETDNHWLPAVHLADGKALVAFLTTHHSVQGSFTDGSARDGQGDVMAAFSSRGPVGSFVKPDITAPGVQILGAHTPTPEDTVFGPPGNYYQAIAGTSMSSPHIAGAAILVRAVHPSWTPGQVKSALMTQATTRVVKEDRTTPADPFDMGAGRVDVGAADAAPVTISDSAAHMAALTGDPQHAIDVNTPSIDAPTMPGRITTTRRLKNVTGHRLTITPTATVSGRTRIVFSPARATLPPGGTVSFTITLASAAPVGTQQFASIQFRTNRGTAHIPVAFVRRQGQVALDQSCDAASIRYPASTTCTVVAANHTFSRQTAHLLSVTDSHLRITGAHGARLSDGHASRSGSLSPTIRGVPSLTAGSTPGPGYLPLQDFGIDALQGVGDETVSTFDVPAFTYNGETFTSLAVDSNGYLVAGHAGANDNECCVLPSGPSPAAPNNVLAPFWTDLNAEGAPGERVATLSDGTNEWIVVQWENRVFGTSDIRSFQLWIGEAANTPGSQDISYAYGAPQADPNGQPFLVGAENAAGAGDMTATLPDGSDRVVTSTAFVPGGSLSYRLTLGGRRSGLGILHSELQTSGVRGTTTVDTPVRVTRR